MSQIIRRRTELNPTDGHLWHTARRPARQTDHRCEQSGLHGPIDSGGAARNDAMIRHGVKTGRRKGCMRVYAPRRLHGKPAVTRGIACERLLSIASVVMAVDVFQTMPRWRGCRRHEPWAVPPGEAL